MPYSFRMTSRLFLYSAVTAQYHGQHCILHTFEQLGATYMHKPNEKYPTGPGFEAITSEVRVTTGSNKRSEPVPLTL